MMKKDKQRKKYPFSRISLVYLFLITTLFFIATLSFYLFTGKNVQEQIIGRIEDQGIIISQEAENQFQSPAEELTNIIRFIQFEGIPELPDPQVSKLFEFKISTAEAYERIMLLDLQGKVIETWPHKPDYIGIDESKVDYYQDAIESDGVSWSRVFISPETGNPTIAISVKSIYGVIVIYYSLDYLNQFIDMDLEDSDDFIVIFDRWGTVIVQSSAESALEREIIGYFEGVKNARQDIFGITIEEYKGITGVVYTTPFIENNYFVLIFERYDKVYSSLSTLRAASITLTGIIILFGLIMYFFLRKIMIQPIVNLTRDIRRISDGYFSSEVSSPFLEFDSLVTSFNNMVNLIQEREKDLTESVNEKNTLLQELYHRTKNNMQVINSMINLQRMKSPDSELNDVLLEIHNRITSMSLVHEMLYQSRTLSRVEMGEYISRLSQSLMSGMLPSSGDVSVDTDVRDIFLLIEDAIPCGLILNELISNTMKYAVPSSKKTRIFISMKKREDGMISLQYKDDGSGLPDEFNPDTSKSLGFNLIQTLSTLQLGGSFRYSSSSGFSCEIEFLPTKLAVESTLE